MKFEKWQALGNDYIIVEETDLPFELTEPRIRRLCALHTGVGSDGVLLLSEAGEGHVARLRIFNPDGSEAELSGNGAREAILYLHRAGWTDRDEFSLITAAGEIRPRITGPRTCRVDMGRASLSSKDFPDGPEDGVGTLQSARREFQFQHVSIGNPQCAIEVEPEELAQLDLSLYGPPIEGHELFPNRTNVSFWRRDPDGGITARIFERGVGETMSSGTGASGAAVAAVVRGVPSPVIVRLDGGELEVDVGDDLTVTLTGWAVPVYTGVLSDEFLEELREAQ